jgi:hypothetical protein
MIARKWNRGKNILYRTFYRETNNDIENSILLAGSARSGTTWLAELLAKSLHARIMFEPFHNGNVSAWQKYPYMLYKNNMEPDNGLYADVNALLTGCVRNAWIDRDLNVFRSRYRVVKEVRANLFLHWIKHWFPYLPVLFIVRHPCAVVASRLSAGWSAEHDLRAFKEQDDLIMDLPGGDRGLLSKPGSEIRKHALIWAITNFIPLQRCDEHQLKIVFYENLVRNPECELNRIFADLPTTFNRTSDIDLRTPSLTSNRSRTSLHNDHFLRDWKTRFSESEIDQILDVCERFGLTRYYTRNPEPEMPFAN